ncbi:MAG: anthranilate phosphoribosyltransferase [Clostridia bacterium]|nr:anthranilate phosphoribosyltransferase [Clostridia bacterium]
MIQDSIMALMQKQDMTFEETEQVVDDILAGRCTDIQIGAFLAALALKGATSEEFAGAAKGMRNHCDKFLNDEDVLEIVGTGGDKSNTFNVSTAAAFICAAAGIKVAKHGNRAATSNCGTADVLEALGMKLAIPPERNREVLDKTNFCFLFAQNSHLMNRFLAPIRRQLPLETAFDILRPIIDYAGSSMHLLGVTDERFVEPLARALVRIGATRCMIVYSEDCLDEISCGGKCVVGESIDGEFKMYDLSPVQYGLPICTKEELSGGTPKVNAAILNDVFAGKKGPQRNAVVFSAALAMHLARGTSMEEGIRISEDILDSGKAAAVLKEVVDLTVDM